MRGQVSADHRTITVRCTNGGCHDPADATVNLPEITVGVLARPVLLCAGCGQYLSEAMPIPGQTITEVPC